MPKAVVPNTSPPSRWWPERAAGASFSGTAVSGRGHGIRTVLEDGTDAAGHNVTISAGAVTGLGGHGVYAKLNRKGW